MTDLETAIMIKNMARETVRRMSATTKNADWKTSSSVSGVRGVFKDEKEAQESAKRQQASSIKDGSKSVWTVKKRGSEFVVWEEK